MMEMSILSKESGSMVYLTESALLNQKIQEVFKHLHMENQKEGLYGGKIKLMEQEYHGNTMVMVKVMVFFESIIVSSNNAM